MKLVFKEVSSKFLRRRIVEVHLFLEMELSLDFCEGASKLLSVYKHLWRMKFIRH